MSTKGARTMGLIWGQFTKTIIYNGLCKAETIEPIFTPAHATILSWHTGSSSAKLMSATIELSIICDW